MVVVRSNYSDCNNRVVAGTVEILGKKKKFRLDLRTHRFYTCDFNSDELFLKEVINHIERKYDIPSQNPWFTKTRVVKLNSVHEIENVSELEAKSFDDINDIDASNEDGCCDCDGYMLDGVYHYFR